MQNFFFIDDCPARDLGGGVTRRILAHDKDLMVCLLHFNKGSIGALHSHPHTQSTFIKSGAFEFEVDGVKKVVRAGDTLYKQPGVIHGCVCLEEGELIDIFTPQRDEFLEA